MQNAAVKNRDLFLINLDFLLPHFAHFDNIIVLPVLLLETLGFMFLVFFLQYDFIFVRKRIILNCH